MMELFSRFLTQHVAWVAMVIIAVWGLRSWRRRREERRRAQEREARRGLLQPEAPRRTGYQRVDPWGNSKR